jgi:hypothetical protein
MSNKGFNVARDEMEYPPSDLGELHRIESDTVALIGKSTILSPQKMSVQLESLAGRRAEMLDGRHLPMREEKICLGSRQYV